MTETSPFHIGLVSFSPFAEKCAC